MFGRERRAEEAQERAVQTQQDADPSTLDRAATALVDRLVALGIEGAGPLSSAQELADKARAKHGDVDSAIDAVVSASRRQAAVGGFVTGLGGFVTLPVALPANILGFYVIATRMVAATAALRGFDVSDPKVRAAVLLVLSGEDASKVLSRVGIRGSGGMVTRVLSSQLPTSAAMLVQKGVGFQLVTKLGTGLLRRLGRAVPLAGAVVGATGDVWLVRRIAATARTEFSEAQRAVGTGR